MFPRMTGDPIYEASTGVPLGLLHMSQGDVVGASSSEVAERQFQREAAMQVMLDDLAQLDATEFEDLLGNRDPEQALLDEMDTMQLDNTSEIIRAGGVRDIDSKGVQQSGFIGGGEKTPPKAPLGRSALAAVGDYVEKATLEDDEE